MDIFNGITIIDFEATSLDNDVAEVIEVGVSWFEDGDWVKADRLYKPLAQITPEISSMTHISNRMVEEKSNFKESIVDVLELMRIEQSKLYVAHNSKWDQTLISKQLTKMDIDLPLVSDQDNWICTLKWAQKVFSNDIEKFNLSFLRYYLDLSVDDDVVAHRAGDDALVTAKLFERLFIETLERISIDLDGDIWKQIREYYDNVDPYRIWPFGKHKGKEIKEVPKDYIEWAIQNAEYLDENSDKFDKRLAKTVELLYS